MICGNLLTGSLVRGLIVLGGMFVLTACSRSSEPPTPRPLPSTAPELIDLVTREMDEYPPPTDAIEALGNLGPEAASATDVITPWLAYKADRGEINGVAAEALAKMGPSAAPALPSLIDAVQWLKDTESLELGMALSSMIAAIGHIGPDAEPAVPTLAELLYSESSARSLVAAWSMAQITQHDWPDSDMRLEYEHGLVRVADGREPRKGPGGTYLLVISAREWWEEEGRKREWSSLK
jgi:hypothetical protein